jgi:hypothetical protein
MVGFFEMIKELIHALESDEVYTQGKGKLRDNNNYFCCLGVAADLCVKKNLASWVFNEDRFRILDNIGDWRTDELTDTLREEFNFSKDFQNDLWNRNDGCGVWENNRQSFHQIAYHLRLVFNIWQ